MVPLQPPIHGPVRGRRGRHPGVRRAPGGGRTSAVAQAADDARRQRRRQRQVAARPEATTTHGQGYGRRRGGSREAGGRRRRAGGAAREGLGQLGEGEGVAGVQDQRGVHGPPPRQLRGQPQPVARAQAHDAGPVRRRRCLPGREGGPGRHPARPVRGEGGHDDVAVEVRILVRALVKSRVRVGEGDGGRLVWGLGEGTTARGGPGGGVRSAGRAGRVTTAAPGSTTGRRCRSWARGSPAGRRTPSCRPAPGSSWFPI